MKEIKQTFWERESPTLIFYITKGNVMRNGFYVSALIEELLSEIIRTRSFDRRSIFMEINFSVKQYLYFFSLWIFLWNISKNDTKFTIALRIKISVSSSIVNNFFIVFSRLCVKTQDAPINKYRLKFYNVDWEKKIILFYLFPFTVKASPVWAEPQM